jgi:CheY-like chemotaxis protein
MCPVKSSMRFSGQVLIVDDDTDSLAAMVSVVRGAGYKTLEAADGEQAIELMREHGVEILIKATSNCPVSMGFNY